MPKTPPPVRPPLKGDRNFISILAVVGIVGAAALAFVLLGKPETKSVVIDTTQAMTNPKGRVIGSDSAPVEIVMWGDFECPGCGQFADLIEPQVRSELVIPGIARYRFADFPLAHLHPTAMMAHNAAACAAAQSQFWPMHDRIYHLRNEWSMLMSGRDSANALRVFQRYARELKLDGDAFDKCLTERPHHSDIMESFGAGQKLGVPSTPTIVVGNRMIMKDRGIATYDDIKAYVDSALADRGLRR